MSIGARRFSWRLPRWGCLLAATAGLVVVGLFLAWWTGRLAIREIEGRGGWHHAGPSSLFSRRFDRFAPDSSVEQIRFRGARLPDEFFRRGRTLRTLKTVWFEECSFGDEAFRLLSDFPNVNELVLDGSDFTAEQAVELDRFPQLLGLRLNGTNITDAAVRHASGAYIGLAQTAVGDASLASLKGLPKLHAIDLSGTRVTDPGVEQLCADSPPWLAYLDLRGTSVTAELAERLRSRLSVVADPRSLRAGTKEIHLPLVILIAASYL